MPISFAEIFPQTKPLIAMIHVPALPGTPAYAGERQQILARVWDEAMLYRDLGVDGLLIENMHDAPYLRRQVGPEVVAWMTAAALAVREAVPELPCGVQVLAGANQAALAVAQAAGLLFIRAEGFVYGHLADEGWLDADAGDLLRYRRHIDAEEIAIWTDLKKKHSAHAATADVSLADTARTAAFARADGLVITGSATGQPTDTAHLAEVRQATPQLPLLVGSGINTQNLAGYFPLADGFIVGSALKQHGHWANPIDEAGTETLVDLLQDLRV